MKRFSIVAAALVCSFLLLVDGRAGGADEKKPQKELDGLWVVQKRESRGKLVRIEDDALFIADGKSYGTNGKHTAAPTNGADVEIDPSKNPKTIDFSHTMGSHKGEKRLGIYKLTGDKLIVAYGEFGSDKRPGKFSTKMAADPRRAADLVTYKRAKK